MLWYGMSGQKLKKIKSDILKKSFSKKYIIEKYEITDEQFELICKWKLKLSYKSIDERLKSIEDKINTMESSDNELIGKRVFCKEYGYGIIVQLFSEGFMFVKFDERPLNIMCNSDKMTTVHDINKKYKLEIV